MTKSQVLFVDDEVFILDGLKRMLRNRRDRWSMSFATSVDEALELLGTTEFDVVVSDINMPGRDGFDLLSTLRTSERMQDIPVVILTGNAERSLKRAALELGATDLLNKPVNHDDLVARISSALRLKAYQDEAKAHTETLEKKILERTAELEHGRIELIWCLGRTSEFKDAETSHHVVRVGHFAGELATALGLDSVLTRRIFLTSPLHDVGKTGIPDEVLLKRGPLTPAEWEVMKQHTRIGAEILKTDVVGTKVSGFLESLFPDAAAGGGRNPIAELGASIALHHHERWDGGGYPEGLRGSDIPLGARITSVADVYDALSTTCYDGELLSDDRIFSVMDSGAGAQFDPEIVGALAGCLATFRDIANRFADPTTSSRADLFPCLESLGAA